MDRRKRRAKSDKIDADLLLRTLLAWLRGEPRVCSMVTIPDEADEDARRPAREREELIRERIALTNRIGATLATLGVDDYNPLRRDRRIRLEALRTAAGKPLPEHAKAKIVRIIERLELVLAQIAALERRRDAVLEKEAPGRAERMIQTLARLRGIGAQSATVLVYEAFIRPFVSGKALGSYAGLTGTPFNSGGSEREQGISKSGNRRLRVCRQRGNLHHGGEQRGNGRSSPRRHVRQQCSNHFLPPSSSVAARTLRRGLAGQVYPARA